MPSFRHCGHGHIHIHIHIHFHAVKRNEPFPETELNGVSVIITFELASHDASQISTSTIHQYTSGTTFEMDWAPLKCELKDGTVVVNDDLRISFQRTIRAPDNGQTSYLPPDLGTFPLKPVSKYANKLHPAMVAKGGVFLPMYRKSGQAGSHLQTD
jgi:hypothetical protein